MHSTSRQVSPTMMPRSSTGAIGLRLGRVQRRGDRRCAEARCGGPGGHTDRQFIIASRRFRTAADAATAFRLEEAKGRRGPRDAHQPGYICVGDRRCALRVWARSAMRRISRTNSNKARDFTMFVPDVPFPLIFRSAACGRRTGAPASHRRPARNGSLAGPAPVLLRPPADGEAGPGSRARRAKIVDARMFEIVLESMIAKSAGTPREARSSVIIYHRGSRGPMTPTVRPCSSSASSSMSG